MAKAIDVARHLIYLRNKDEKDEKDETYYPLSNLKLQKLLYFCQGGHYKWEEKRLITDNYFELWAYGACIEKMYVKFRKYGQNDIDDDEKKLKNIKISAEEKSTIETVWHQLRDLHVFDLVERVINDPPHTIAKESNSIFIEEDDIKDYFIKH